MASGLRPGAVDRGRLPVQTRDRRAALSALALLLVVAGALGSALVVYRSGHRTDVLVAAHEIKPGSVMKAEDFSTVRVATDSGSLIRATAKRNFLGTVARSEIPAGTLLNREFFLAGSMIPDNGVIVGITVPVAQRPALALKDGDIVRVFGISKDAPTVNVTPGTNGATVVSGGAVLLVSAAKVVEETTNASTGDLTVSLLVKDSDAPAVVAADAAGAVAVGRLARSTQPTIDFKAPAPATPTA